VLWINKNLFDKSFTMFNEQLTMPLIPWHQSWLVFELVF
jgi:hypothetical protein